jgi:hypothetical protein
MLRMQKADNRKETYCLTLQSGSVYLQRSEVPLYLSYSL